MPDLKTPSVPALERALEIMELLAASGSGMTLPEIAGKLELPRSSVHCLLITLERNGYLRRNARTNHYLFGSKLFALANMALSGLELREVAAPFMRQLMERTGLTVHLGILERYEAVLIEKVDPPGTFKLATWLGKRMDVHCTGIGKALIAFLSDEELQAVAHEHGLPKHNDNTIVSLRKLRDEMANIRRLGFSTDDEEDEIGFRCIGAPVFDPAAAAVAAISISGTVHQVREDNYQTLAAAVKQAAAEISRALAPAMSNAQPQPDCASPPTP